MVNKTIWLRWKVALDIACRAILPSQLKLQLPKLACYAVSFSLVFVLSDVLFAVLENHSVRYLFWSVNLGYKTKH